MNRIISAVLLATALLLQPPRAMAQEEAAVKEPSRAPAAEAGDKATLKENPPARYVVEKGDTLWSISERFLQNPWRWPDVWGINKDYVKNPHLIYPGDVIILDLTGATPRLRLEGMAENGTGPTALSPESRWNGAHKLSPQIRTQDLSAAPIPTLSPRLIEPFLSKAMLVDPDAVLRAPRIVAQADGRVLAAAGHTVYAEGVTKSEGRRWTIYRPGRRFEDPDTKELLGYEAIYLGNFEVDAFGAVSSGTITKGQQEITSGDRLAVALPASALPFIPRAPVKPVRGKVVAGADGSVAEIPPLSVVVLNRGGRDGLDVGHVLGLFHSEGVVRAANTGRTLRLPEERYGVAMVFKVFPRMSYALVLSASRPVHINDVVHNP
ncbi:MAG: LysM peptidoglycan-binding domain-containing protein [Burkholderiales bacterium]